MKAFPVRCNGEAFKNIAAFQLVGYSAWNGEAAGSSPACYTNPGNIVCSTVSAGTPLLRFVSVMVNIFDCLSKAMSSSLIRTAKILSGAMAAWQSLKLLMIVRVYPQ